MKRIIVSGHGQFATGIKESIELLSGQHDFFTFVDFIEGMSQEQLKEKFVSLINDFISKGDEIIFFTDIAGGTPYKVAAELSINWDKIVVVAGCNTGALLESIFDKENKSLIDVADDLVERTKSTVNRFGRENF